MVHLIRDAVLVKKGAGNWHRRLACWLRGEHKWSGELREPYPCRPKVCKWCGARWEYIYPIRPPSRGCVAVECPNCYLLAYRRQQSSTCTCHHCGWAFTVRLVELATCEHCGRVASAGETSCAGCGAPIN
jgi:hypothetical protein